MHKAVPCRYSTARAGRDSVHHALKWKSLAYADSLSIRALVQLTAQPRLFFCGEGQSLTLGYAIREGQRDLPIKPGNT